MSKLANEIKYERKRRKLKQSDMAEKLNISIRTYQRYEKGINQIPQPIISKLSKILNLNYRELIQLQLDDTEKDVDYLLQNYQYLIKLAEYKGYKIDIDIETENEDEELLRLGFDPISTYDTMENIITKEKISFIFMDFFNHITDYLEFYIKQEFKAYHNTIENTKKLDKIKQEHKEYIDSEVFNDRD